MLDAYDQTALNLAHRGNRGSIPRIKKRLSCVKTSGLFGGWESRSFPRSARPADWGEAPDPPNPRATLKDPAPIPTTNVPTSYPLTIEHMF